MQLTALKLGGSLITDKAKPLTERGDIITKLAEEIVFLYKNYPQQRWLLGNGAGSFGHYTAHQVAYSNHRSSPQAIAAVHNSVVALNHMVVNALTEAGLPAISMPPQAFISVSVSKIHVHTNIIQQQLELGLIPVVFGDVVMNSKTGTIILSTEEILDNILRSLVKTKDWKCNNFLYATSVDGVLAADGAVIPNLVPSDPLDSIGKTVGFDVTGGMRQKVTAGFRALDYTDRVIIFNGEKAGNLKAIMTGKALGTRLTP